MEVLAIELEGKRGDLQSFRILVPLGDPSLNPNDISLRRRLSVGYSDEDFPLEEIIFLDTWDIMSPKD